MAESVSWNPWHGCTKISPGCAHCYVYRGDERYGRGIDSRVVRKTGAFRLPIEKKRDGSYRVAPGSHVYTCFTSDFLLADADAFRDECWQMIRQRQDCVFCFFTKRIERLPDCLPPDWGDGYENVVIGCTVEDQARAEQRLPVFLSLPIRHRLIITSPLLEKIDLSAYLCDRIGQVSVGGESGPDARVCDFSWVLSLRDQCVAAHVPFFFHQTGAFLRKDGHLYRIPRAEQHRQARKAGIDVGQWREPSPPAGSAVSAAPNGTQLSFDDMESQSFSEGGEP